MGGQADDQREQFRRLLTPPFRPRFFSTAMLAALKLDVALAGGWAAVLLTLVSMTDLRLSGRTILWASLVLIFLCIVGAASVFSRRWTYYVLELEQRARFVRQQLLTFAGIEDAPAQVGGEIVLDAIENVRGGVKLRFRVEAATGLRVGSRLALVVSATGEVWGVIRISEVVEGWAWAAPIDRRRPEFWEKLEDQMRYNPAPPLGFHLEPFRPEALTYGAARGRVEGSSND